MASDDRPNRLRVPGFVGQHADIDPDLAQCTLVFFIDVVAEDQIRIGVSSSSCPGAQPA
jgi:hypothetical protein